MVKSDRYTDVLEIAQEAANLLISDWWGRVTEGMTWEEFEGLKATVAYSIATGFQYHQEVATQLLYMLHGEASDEDGNPAYSVECARRCLQKLKPFEQAHDIDFKAYDLAAQIMQLAPRPDDVYHTTHDIGRCILYGLDFDDIVGSRLENFNASTAEEKALAANIRERLQPFVENQKERCANLLAERVTEYLNDLTRHEYDYAEVSCLRGKTTEEVKASILAGSRLYEEAKQIMGLMKDTAAAPFDFIARRLYEDLNKFDSQHFHVKEYPPSNQAAS